MKNKTKIMNVPFVDLKTQHHSISDEINEAISSVVQRTAFILGPEVKSLEEAFANYCGTKYAVGVDSGTSALELALRAYHIGAGDEVITVANTFIATALAITHTGALPVLVDIDEHTYNIDIKGIENAITENTKAIIPVHLYGQPADMDPIMEIARRHDLIVIEDSCQGHGAKYKERKAGSLAHCAAFSFYPSKNLGAYGDAGMVVTNDERVVEYIKMVRNVGQSKKYHHEVKGHNHRIDNLQAAILNIKLNYLDDWNTARRQHSKLYNHLLADCDVVTPFEAEYSKAVYHLYVIRTKDRDGLMSFLQEHNIGAGIHYPIPIHLQAAYQDLGYQEGAFPITEEYANQIVSLPMYPELTSDHIEYVAEKIREYTS
jgi:dTDP-4-amino-4,6-dideoxygalactose transaminase